MSLSNIPSGRTQISFFGLRNAGKTSLVSAVTGPSFGLPQGATTAPVEKSVELQPIGRVRVVDTPGLDDAEYADMQAAMDVLNNTDIAVLVVDAARGLSPQDQRLLQLLDERSLPHVVAYNKADLLAERAGLHRNEQYVSAMTGENVAALRELLGTFAAAPRHDEPSVVLTQLAPGDLALLVLPDAGGPGETERLVMEELLDRHCAFAACRLGELPRTLAALSRRPRLVVSGAEAFTHTAQGVPDDVPLVDYDTAAAWLRSK